MQNMNLKATEIVKILDPKNNIPLFANIKGKFYEINTKSKTYKLANMSCIEISSTTELDTLLNPAKPNTNIMIKSADGKVIELDSKSNKVLVH